MHPNTLYTTDAMQSKNVSIKNNCQMQRDLKMLLVKKFIVANHVLPLRNYMAI